FFEIWEARCATRQQRYVALKGYCNTLDARGQYYLAETEVEAGLNILARERQIEEQRARKREEHLQRQQDDTTLLLWGGATVLAGTIIYSLFKPSSKAA